MRVTAKTKLTTRQSELPARQTYNKTKRTHGRINFFKDMVEARLTDLTSKLEMDCLWFCFSELLQKILDEIREHWNTHHIRGSRHNTVKGRPDSLYYLPELHGATDP